MPPTDVNQSEWGSGRGQGFGRGEGKGGCEPIIEVIVKMQKDGGGGSGWM